jgi:hypothetical protein
MNMKQGACGNRKMKANDIFAQLARLQAPIRLAILAFAGLILACPAALILLIPEVRADGAADEITKLLIAATQEQVALLKWIGGIMVSAETGAILFLVKALFTANNVLIKEVKESAVARVADSRARQEAHEGTRHEISGLSGKVGELASVVERLRLDSIARGLVVTEAKP